jgi:hypothetical protein
MAAIVTVAANKMLDATLGTTALTAFSGAAKIKLTTTAPTASAAGTELTGGSGYTTGGSTIVFAAASANAAANSGSAITWTNGSGGAWSIVGLEIWDSAGTPLRWWFGNWTGQPISVPIGAIFSIATSAVSIGLT